MKTDLIIYLVDDHALFREGVKFLLSNCSYITSIHEANNGRELLDMVLEVKPDVILMDIEMPELNGVDTTRQVLKIMPDAKVIALSMYAHQSFYTDMLDAGAKGFLLKNSKFEDVQAAICEVVKGGNYFSPEILNSIIKGFSNKSTTALSNIDLSSREVEVLFNICKGLSNQEIADLLIISKRTVDKHRENILLKTQSRNTAELVVFAIKNKYFVV